MSQIEVKANFTVDEAGVVEGIAWPFGSPDRVGDLIEKGAFATAVAPIPMLAFHEQRETVGVWDSIMDSDAGLQVKGRLLIKDLPRAREVRAMIRERALSGLSIGFSTTKAAPGPGVRGRAISALKLLGISVVAVPAHLGARISGIIEAIEMLDDQDAAANAVAALIRMANELAANIVNDLGSINLPEGGAA